MCLLSKEFSVFRKTGQNRTLIAEPEFDVLPTIDRLGPPRWRPGAAGHPDRVQQDEIAGLTILLVSAAEPANPTSTTVRYGCQSSSISPRFRLSHAILRLLHMDMADIFLL